MQPANIWTEKLKDIKKYLTTSFYIGAEGTEGSSFMFLNFLGRNFADDIGILQEFFKNDLFSRNCHINKKVRMAERSKAPDSRDMLFASVKWAFWSSNEGVGSNLTSDTNFFVFLT